MTDQPTNPLMDGKAKRPRRVTPEMLAELAAKLNRSKFVQANGWRYFVGRQFIDDQWKATLERADAA